MKTPEQIAEVFFQMRMNAGYTAEDADGVRAMAKAAIEADRAQRGHYDTLTTIYVIQSEDGDVVDLTDNREYAEWLTREDDDNPIRTCVKETVWSGPESQEDW